MFSGSVTVMSASNSATRSAPEAAACEIALLSWDKVCTLTSTGADVGLKVVGPEDVVGVGVGAGVTVGRNVAVVGAGVGQALSKNSIAPSAVMAIPSNWDSAKSTSYEYEYDEYE